MKALIAICTFNPDAELLDKVIDSCLRQTISGRVILIDNASTRNTVKLAAIKHEVEYLSCKKPGIAEARYFALKQQKANELIVFVDDDNLLDKCYIEFALDNAINKPHWGAFGGKLELPADYFVPKRVFPFLPYLAIKDLGPLWREEKASLHWNELEPPGAGVCIRPEVTEKIIEKISSGRSYFFRVGAVGDKQFRGEDSYLVRQAFFLDYYWGYDPRLKLSHRFAKSRLRGFYLVKLLIRYGVSDIRLNQSLNIDPLYPYPRNLISLTIEVVYHLRKGSSGVPTALRLLGQFIGARELESV